MNFGAVSYDTVPPVPTVNALPGDIPQGPWPSLYRAAPNAQIPAVRYPGMQGAFGGGFKGAIAGGLGAPVQIVGSFGQGALSKTEAVTGLLVAAGISAGTGAAFAATLRSSRPVLYPSLLLGGMTFVTGLIGMMLSGANGASA